ncbi:hypothetical protein [Novosphingobium sp. B 225]|uniref:hypothetical protein n=1 Tax=Novosphingobium sp. B 225 TaxID=1961849 RepID=UPI001124F8BE|nr:hypothetical protein [Novosphingobium sp. B 225]
MASQGNLNQAVLPRLEKYRSIISAAGIRYGSVAYISFGPRGFERSVRGGELEKYPVSLEFGSDVWRLIRHGKILLDSENCDQEAARKIISEALVGSRLVDIEAHKNESIVRFENDTYLISEILSEPESGFLYGFQAEDEPAWETVDGILLQT